MKRILVFLALSIPALAGTETPVVAAVAPAPKCSIEVTGSNMFATRNLMGHGTTRFNIAGGDLTGVYNINDKHAFTLRGSALTGRHADAAVNGAALSKLDISLMPGYRFTYHVNDRASVFAGANGGFVFSDINPRHSYRFKLHEDERRGYGLGASAEIGCKYEVNDKWSVLASYGISADNARPTFLGQKQYCQFYHGFHAGVGYKF